MPTTMPTITHPPPTMPASTHPHQQPQAASEIHKHTHHVTSFLLVTSILLFFIYPCVQRGAKGKRWGWVKEMSTGPSCTSSGP